MYFLESQIAKKLHHGKNLAFAGSFVQIDDRLLQKEMIAGFEKSPEYLVFGSSTTMQISTDIFQGRSFFNHSVRRGVLEDYLAMAQIYRDRGWKPRKLILGLDSWIFDPLYWRTYWKSLAAEYERFVQHFNIDWKRNRKAIHRLESLTQDASAFARGEGWKKLILMGSLVFGVSSVIRETDNNFEKEYVKRFDGSVGYHASFRSQSPEEVLNKILCSRIFPAITIEEGSVRAFDQFISGLRGEGFEMVFYLPALHPGFFDLRGKNILGESIQNYSWFVRNLDAVEEKVRESAFRYQIPVMGSYRSDLQLLNGNDFYDWIHLRPEGLKKVFSNPFID